jgi:hypothetical protein
MNLLLITILAAILIVSSASSVIALPQTDQPNGYLEGEVVDPNGALVPGVTIMVEAKKFKRSVLTDSEGKYRVELPPGKYRVTAEALASHRFRQKRVVIKPKFVFKLNINLKFGKPIIVDDEHP